MKKESLLGLFGLLCLGFLPGCGSKVADEVKVAYATLPEVIDFNFHVRPIISDRCFKCHGPDENARQAKLRLDVESAALSRIPDRESIPLVAGSPEKSAVIQRILSHDPERVMPPPASNLALSDLEKATLLKWVEQGANWKKHWAYIAPEKAPLPEVEEAAWLRNEIDAFVLHKLEGMGMARSEEAVRETLIRRLSFDLIGLPPEPAEVAAFVADRSEGAYEALVDRLLASPHFGERWAWEWLDVARYADTNGYQADPTRSMWPWRDWVVKAFNENLPYDRFTVMQLAGDLLPEGDEEALLATAFNRNHMHNGEGGRIIEETRIENAFDKVETMGTVWLGLTMNCARCHDHKFDAFSQKEYYSMMDYFNQTSETGKGFNGRIAPVLDLSSAENIAERKVLAEVAKEIGKRVEAVEWEKFPREKGEKVSANPEAELVSQAIFKVYDRKPFERNPNQLKSLGERFEEDDPEYSALLMELRDARAEMNRNANESIQVMVMDEVDELRATHVLERGTYSKPGEEVSAGVPATLPALPETARGDRLDLAKWLVSREHPLTARVTVNRYWQAFFGKGIVDTPEDFGVQGSLPTHPELLDWLAVDFQESGWDVKALFKKIVMSATYRQASAMTAESLERDPENKYLGRATRMRLPSWMLRDQALFASGLLVDEIGGAPVKPYQPEGIWEEATFGDIKYKQDEGDALYRRTLYTFWRRIVSPTVLFDNSSRQTCSVNAMRTNTPLHALTTLNDVTYVEAARLLAERVLLTEGTDDERLAAAFEWATSRRPKGEELSILRRRLAKLREAYAQSEDAACELTSVGAYPQNHDLDLVDYAAYTAIGSALLNLDETITRQ